ncbi:Recombinase A [Aggregatibacter aphrophilus]|uniref:Recombinase A n=1 Tax=Aggregatibacter aphrophilus TaxID=732 RepID=A0A336NA64_AGGAP|nr:Recombinase A [Aggregatibacter aphrophilus]
MATQEEKQKALEAALGQIEKQFGKGAIMKLGDSQNWILKRFPPVPSVLT